MTMVSADGISMKELEDFIATQMGDLVPTKFRELSGAGLTCRGIQISPQWIFYKVMDDK